MKKRKIKRQSKDKVSLKYITYAELKELRYKNYQKQRGICPILKQKIEYRDAVMDHKHKTKAEEIGEDSKGLLRGVLHFQANSWEGKVTNAFQRYGLHKFNISLSTALRNLADFLDNPPMSLDNIRYVHPSERPKKKMLGKRQYNKIIKFFPKMYPKSKKFPKFPRSGKLTKQFAELLTAVDEFEKKIKK